MDVQMLPPIAQLSEQDRGPIVIVYTYILIINTIILTAVKISGTVLMKQKFHGDDLFIVTATLLGLAQSIITERSAINGVGRYQDSLTSSQLEAYFKRAFVSNILSIVVQSLAKTSVVFLIQRISSTVTKSLACRILYASIGAWSLFSILAISLQCGTPHPWNYQPSQCVGQGALWYPVIIFNVLTDLAIASFFGPVIWELQIAQSSKLRISALFAARIIVCALSIAQLVEMSTALRSTDTTRAMQVSTVIGQFVMNFSIMTAIAPSVYRFLNELHAGLGFGRIIEQIPYELDERTLRDSNPSSENRTGKSFPKPLFRPDIPDGTTVGISSYDERSDSVVTIHAADRGSKNLIIRQTQEWCVESRNAASLKSIDASVIPMGSA